MVGWRVAVCELVCTSMLFEYQLVSRNEVVEVAEKMKMIAAAHRG